MSSSADTEGLKAAIIESLRVVHDPEIPVNIVDLGLVYDVRVEADGTVEVDMTLTSMGCPVQVMIQSDAELSVVRAEGVIRVNVEFIWSAPWGMDKITEARRKQLRMIEYSI